MSLNIKDPEAHRLAQAISRATGESMTRVVTEALRERLAKIERRKNKASVKELLAIADRAAARMSSAHTSPMANCSTMKAVCRNDPRYIRARRYPIQGTGGRRFRTAHSRC